MASLPQGLFIPAVTTLYFAGALQVEGNYDGFISYYNRRFFACFAAPHFTCERKVWREMLEALQEVRLKFISCPLNSWVGCNIFLETLFSFLNCITQLRRKVSDLQWCSTAQCTLVLIWKVSPN
jgi:hypothetical protein